MPCENVSLCLIACAQNRSKFQWSSTPHCKAQPLPALIPPDTMGNLCVHLRTFDICICATLSIAVIIHGIKLFRPMKGGMVEER